MVKGNNNRMELNESTVALAVEEYINNRLKIGVNVTVTGIFQGTDDNDYRFVVNFKEAK